MGIFLEIIGALGVLVVCAIAGIVVAGSGPGNEVLVIMGILPWALPAVVGCIVLAAFGRMLQHLGAIRRESETQTALLREHLSRGSKVAP